MIKRKKRLGRTLRLGRTFSKYWGDDLFLHGIRRLENIVAKVLSLTLVIVIVLSVIDLFISLANDLLFSDSAIFFSKSLIEIFGLFLNILIALELLENITVYLKKHIFQVELVVMTALIAVARKIIIFDSSKLDQSNLTSLAFAILALSVSYWLIRRMNQNL